MALSQWRISARQNNVEYTRDLYIDPFTLLSFCAMVIGVAFAMWEPVTATRIPFKHHDYQ